MTPDDSLKYIKFSEIVSKKRQKSYNLHTSTYLRESRKRSFTHKNLYKTAKLYSQAK